jgi:hypothetical protein
MWGISPAFNIYISSLTISNAEFCTYVFHMILSINRVFFGVHGISQLVFVKVKSGVLFDVRTEFLNRPTI